MNGKPGKKIMEYGQPQPLPFHEEVTELVWKLVHQPWELFHRISKPSQMCLISGTTNGLEAGSNGLGTVSECVETVSNILETASSDFESFKRLDDWFKRSGNWFKCFGNCFKESDN